MMQVPLGYHVLEEDDDVEKAKEAEGVEWHRGFNYDFMFV